MRRGGAGADGLTLAVLVLVLGGAYSHSEYQSLIPNGSGVRRNGVLWAAGHVSSGGGGSRCPFGRDFEAAGLRWTKALCEKDSDGDGFHNGWELGDPCCVWSVGGGSPARATDISHPGFSDSKPVSPGCVSSSTPSGSTGGTSTPSGSTGGGTGTPGAGSSTPDPGASTGSGSGSSPSSSTPTPVPQGPSAGSGTPSAGTGSGTPAAPAEPAFQSDPIVLVVEGTAQAWRESPSLQASFASSVAAAAGVRPPYPPPLSPFPTPSPLLDPASRLPPPRPSGRRTLLPDPAPPSLPSLRSPISAPPPPSSSPSPSRTPLIDAVPQTTADRVRVLNIADGSVVLTLAIAAPSAAEAAAAAARLAAALEARSLSLPGFSVDFARSRVVTAVPPAPEPAKPVQYNWIAFAIVVGGTLVLGALLHWALPTERGMGAFLLHKRFPLAKKSTFGPALCKLAYLGMLAAWGAYYATTSAKDSSLGRAADAFAHMTQLQLLFVLLPATRNSVFVHLLGIPSDRAMKYHAFVSTRMIISGWVHGALQVAHHATSGTRGAAWVFQWTGSAEGRVNLAGLIAAIVFLAGWLLARGFVRRRWYELFLWGHRASVAGFAFAIIHDRSSVPFVVPGVLLLALDHALRFALARSRQAKLLSMRVEPGGILRLEISRPGAPITGPSQYVFLQVPAVRALEWHPFSASSGPSPDGSFTLHIRPQGPGSFTADLAALAESCKGRPAGDLPLVRVEGPYGRPAVALERYENFVAVTGGVGLGPALSAAHWLAEHSQAVRSVRLLFTTRDEASALAFAEPLRALQAALARRKVPRKISRILLIPLEVSIHVTRGKDGAAGGGGGGGGAAAAPSAPAAVLDVGLEVHSAQSLKRGRPDLSGFLKSAAAGPERESPFRPAALLICGPASLSKEARRAADAAGGFHVHEEPFSFL
eukprot:tig00000475_g1230.t1